MRVSSFLLMILPFLPAISANVESAAWSKDQRLTSDPGISRLSFNFARCIAADESDRVHIVWYDSRENFAHIYYQRSEDGGITWGPDNRLSAANASYPSIAISSSMVYVVWFQVSAERSDIYFTCSSDRGATWQIPVRLSHSGKAAHPSIAATGPDVHVSWMDNRYGNTEVFVMSSLNEGINWTEEQVVSDLPYESWVPTIAASGKNVFVAWVDYKDANEEEYIRQSADRGKTWAPGIRLAQNPADSWAPSIDISGRMIHIIWFDRRNARNSDSDVEKKLDEAMRMIGLPDEPAPARDPAVYYLPEFQKRLQKKMMKIQEAAPPWVQNGGDPARLKEVLKSFERKKKEWAHGWEIYYKQSMDGGLNWSRDIRLTRARSVSARPSLVVSNSDLHVVWYDSRKGNMEVYYKHSTDSGKTWKRDVRLTSNEKDSLHPMIAVSPNYVHVVWYDDRNGNSEIYYKHKKQ